MWSYSNQNLKSDSAYPWLIGRRHWARARAVDLVSLITVLPVFTIPPGLTLAP